MDWKAIAKAQRLKVREFAQEDEQRLGLVFDRHLPNARAETLEQFEKAVAFCACLAWHYYETGAMISFVTEGFETSMAPAAEIIYPVLEKLAIVEPVLEGSPGCENLVADSPPTLDVFRIIRPRRSIPTEDWRSSYFVSIDSL